MYSVTKLDAQRYIFALIIMIYFEEMPKTSCPKRREIWKAAGEMSKRVDQPYFSESLTVQCGWLLAKAGIELEEVNLSVCQYLDKQIRSIYGSHSKEDWSIHECKSFGMPHFQYRTCINEMVESALKGRYDLMSHQLNT